MSEEKSRLYDLANNAIETLQRAYSDFPAPVSENHLLAGLQMVRKLQLEIYDAKTI